MPPNTPAQTATPGRKKSFKALIITLVILFFVAPLIVGATALAVLPSVRLCADLARTGNQVSDAFESKLELATYRYSCLTQTPPTTKSQSVTLGLVSDATYQSREAFQTVISTQLTDNGWAVAKEIAASVDTEQSTVFAKADYTATLTINSYQPAYAKVTLKPNAPKMNFGLVFNAPEAPQTLSNEQKLKYVTAAIYVPEYVPEGYSSWSVSASYSSNAQGTATLEGGTGRVNPQLSVSPLPSEYDITAGRELLGTTPNGTDLYIATTGSTLNKSAIVAIAGPNLVTFQYAYKHIYVSPQLTTEQVWQVVDSLKQTNTPAK